MFSDFFLFGFLKVVFFLQQYVVDVFDDIYNWYIHYIHTVI
jgi:hypothetical protein